MLAGGCDSGGAAPTVSTGPAVQSTPSGSVTTPAADSEFCREITDLDARLADEQDSARVVDDVVSTYRELLPSAPFEITAELEAVVARLEREQAGDPLDDTERAMADEAALTIAQFVDANCQGVLNNPGPPATAPP
jgi:hypothetical protein